MHDDPELESEAYPLAPNLRKPSGSFVKRLRGSKEPKGNPSGSPSRGSLSHNESEDSLAPSPQREKKTGVARQVQRLGHWATHDHPQYSPSSSSAAVAAASPQGDTAATASAASRIQGSFRRQGKATSAAAKGVVNKSIARTVDAKDSIVEKATLAEGRVLNVMVEEGLTQGIKVAVATDPWIPKWAAKAVSSSLIAVIHEANERKMHAELGKRSAQLRQSKAEALDPARWPIPPPLSRPFHLLRAKFLYAVCAADKSFCYGFFHSPCTLLTWVILYAPPIFPLFPLTIALWFFYFLCVITVQDEFTLFNYIASFKTWCFVMCGVLPIFADFFLVYFHGVSAEAHDIDAHDRDYGLLSWYGLVTSRAFIALWVVCWIVFARYRSIRSLHFGEVAAATDEKPQPPAGKGRDKQPVRERNQQMLASAKTTEDESGITIYNAVHTGDQDTGDREQTLLMKWDAVAILLHVLFGLLEVLIAPTRKELLFEAFICTTLSVLAAPFVLWKIPVVGELIHQMRPTGFDEAGGLRLTMSLADMKTKHEREQGQPRGVRGLGQMAGGKMRGKAGFCAAGFGKMAPRAGGLLREEATRTTRGPAETGPAALV